MGSWHVVWAAVVLLLIAVASWQLYQQLRELVVVVGPLLKCSGP
jgi:hypothetical protein